MLTAEPPVIVNGVVFVLAAGEYTGQANDAEGGFIAQRKGFSVRFRPNSSLWTPKPARSYTRAETRSRLFFIRLVFLLQAKKSYSEPLTGQSIASDSSEQTAF